MIEKGTLVFVEARPEGSSLTADVAAAGTLLPVKRDADFTGTLLEVGGETHTYTVTDAGELLLTAGLTTAAVEGDPVFSLNDLGDPESTWVALVRLSEDDEEPVEAVIKTGDRGYFHLGDTDAGALVEVESTGDGYRAVSRPVDPAVLDGASVDASTLDVTSLPPVPTTDGDAPDNATTVTPIGGIGSMFYRWTEITNNDPVTYRLHVRAGSAPATDGTYEVAAGVGLTSAAVRKLKDGTAIVGDGSVTYHAVVTVEDADGPGPASADVTGVPAQIVAVDIAVDTITATQIAPNAVSTGELAANAVTAAKIAANTITAAQIAANAITAGQIQANAITAAEIATGTITATQLAANAVTAAKIAAGAVTATSIAADAIDGKTVTGALVRTAASGARWELGRGSVSNQLHGFSGQPAETGPGVLEVDFTPFPGVMDIYYSLLSSPQAFDMGAYTEQRVVRFVSGATTSTSRLTASGPASETASLDVKVEQASGGAVSTAIELAADSITLTGNLAGSVGTGTLRDSVRAAIQADYAAGVWTAYTPTFTASVTNPTLANFTISGRYIQHGKTVTFVALFTCNTAANMGSGNYQFGLPVAARATNEVVCIAQQSGPNHGYQGRGASTTTINLFLTSTDAVATVTSTGMAAATSIRITGTYEAA